MATLLMPREDVRHAIAGRIRAGKELVAKAEIADTTGRYEDWLHIVAKWREETAAGLTTLPHAKSALELGLLVGVAN